VIVFEDVGVVGMFKRSGETFKNTWGETAGAGFGVGIVSVLFALVGLGVAVLVFFLVGDTVGVVGAVAVAAAALLLAYLLGTTLTGIAKTALYVYATEGQRPREFENVDFGRASR
jgi:Flp pilus assembly protein TadB